MIELQDNEVVHLFKCCGAVSESISPYQLSSDYTEMTGRVWRAEMVVGKEQRGVYREVWTPCNVTMYRWI